MNWPWMLTMIVVVLAALTAVIQFATGNDRKQ